MKRWILRLRLLTLAAWLYDVYRLVVKPRTRGALVALWCQGRVLCSELPPEQTLARELTGHLRDYLNALA